MELSLIWNMLELGGLLQLALSQNTKGWEDFFDHGCFPETQRSGKFQHCRW